MNASTVVNHIQQLSHYFHEYFGDDDISMFQVFEHNLLKLRSKVFIRPGGARAPQHLHPWLRL